MYRARFSVPLLRSLSASLRDLARASFLGGRQRLALAAACFSALRSRRELVRKTVRSTICARAVELSTLRPRSMRDEAYEVNDGSLSLLSLPPSSLCKACSAPSPASLWPPLSPTSRSTTRAFLSLLLLPPPTPSLIELTTSLPRPQAQGGRPHRFERHPLDLQEPDHGPGDVRRVRQRPARVDLLGRRHPVRADRLVQRAARARLALHRRRRRPGRALARRP